MRPLPVRVLFALASAVALGAGCAGYELGPTNRQVSGERSVHVNYFANDTIEPRLVEAVCQALRRDLQQDGTFRLGSASDADLIVTGTILEYDRKPIAYLKTDSTTPQDYELRVTTRVIATERASGKVVFDRKVLGRTAIYVGNDLSSAERQSIPVLADDLAHNATTFLAEGRW